MNYRSKLNTALLTVTLLAAGGCLDLVPQFFQNRPPSFEAVLVVVDEKDVREVLLHRAPRSLEEDVGVGRRKNNSDQT